jgi:tetratricopeptide (TPR) repeat protein
MTLEKDLNADSHKEHCACDHAHDHSHDHSHGHSHGYSLSLPGRWLVSILMVGILLVLLRSFLVSQMLVRVTSYSANSSYADAVRMCQKIIVIDKNNKQALVSLGYAYMDMAQLDMAIPVFEKVLSVYPDDKAAASYELGQAHYSKGEYTKAIADFERVRSAGPRAGVLLEADILKYRHGTLGFRSLNSMQTMLGSLVECYQKTGDAAKAAEIQKEYAVYKNKHSRVLF